MESKTTLIEKGLLSKYLLDLEKGRIAFDNPNPEEQIYYTDRVNFVEQEDLTSWKQVKDLWFQKYKDKLFFLAHTNDIIKGKAQLIDNVKRKIPLLRKIFTKGKNYETGESIEISHISFFDEKLDKRFNTSIREEVFSLEFRLYRVIDEDSKEYYIFSEQELPFGVCEFKGMIVPVEDVADVSKNLKFKSIANVFFLESFTPAVKVLGKEQIVSFTKEREIDSYEWTNYLNYHAQGTFNVFQEDTNILRSAFLLSGKVNGYPLHLWIWGRAGTKKSAFIETLASKFDENLSILEGGNSRVKSLTPSFKEKPCNMGYLAKSDRVGFVDEVGKMVEFEQNKHDTQIANILGECNFLLENKKRMVGSGNDNDIIVQADAKFLWASNPLSKSNKLSDIAGVIDVTTLSRCLQWVQDYEETNFLLSEKSVSKVPPTPTELNNKEKRKNSLYLFQCGGDINIYDYITRDEFLTIFDTCNSFLSEIKDSEVERITNTITLLAKEPLKSQIWKPRGLHHTKLLIDGLCKFRCLFEDYDSSFKATEIDYQRAEKLLSRMARSWETSFSIDWKDGFGGTI